jgi:hypothetical protein
MPTKQKNWKRVLGQKVAHLSPDEARAILEAHRKRGIGMGDPAYRALTGGYSSQSIDFYVTRKLGLRAGIIKSY